MTSPRRVAVIASSRIPFTKSFTHYAKVSAQDMMTFALRDLVYKMNIQGDRLDEVALGAVTMHAGDWNLARECVLGSGLSPETPAFDIRRACGTSLESIIAVANKISLGQAEVGIGGGCDTNSDTPIEFRQSFAHKLIKLGQSRKTGDKIDALLSFRPKDLIPKLPAVTEPRTGKSMGGHCELMAKEWRVSRQEQDQLAFESHQKAAAAYDEGFYDDIVCEYEGLQKDSLVRGDTTVEKLSKLRPAFDKRSGGGTLTAGNSTALTDGASCVLLASEDYAKAQGWEPLCYIRDAQASGIDFVKGEGLLMAPTIAVGQLLERQQMSFADFDVFEIHEAFAAQALCTFKAWEDAHFCKEKLGRDEPLGSIPREKLNVKGGSVALGHPFGATGGRIAGGLAKILKERGEGCGLISICTGGGMGVAAIFER